MLAINKLFFRYKGAETLFANLNLQLASGSICGLLGRNGAGKTTLLKIIAGLVFPYGGNCQVAGYNPRERLPQFLQEIYFIPEEFYVPAITAKTYLNLYAPFYKDFDVKIFTKSLREFKLDTNKKLTSLSYGQKKKFLVAFGLATNCKLLILDEPTNGLDIPGKSQFRKLLASLLTDDKTFLIATHQVRDMENLIDGVIVLDDGEIIFQQPFDKIAKRLSFIRQQKAPAKDKVIYMEKTLAGYFVVTENKTGSETQIDIEMLFNAIMTNKAKIQEIFYEN